MLTMDYFFLNDEQDQGNGAVHDGIENLHRNSPQLRH